jgi:hypothetical protein
MLGMITFATDKAILPFVMGKIELAFFRCVKAIGELDNVLAFELFKHNAIIISMKAKLLNILVKSKWLILT